MEQNELFIKAIQKEGGQNVNLCYQCKKCTAGCPIVEEMDFTPTQIIQAIRLGMKDLVLTSKTIWLCASCQTCTTRCPQEVDIAGIMDAARIIARKERIKPRLKNVPSFNTSVLESIRMFGRLYELGMLSLLKLRTREFTKDLGLGIKMLKKGKLRLLPSFSSILATNKIFTRVKKAERE